MNTVLPLGPTTALIVVDMQIDFGLPSGSLHVPGAEDILTPVNTLIDATLAAGGKVFYTQDFHPADTPHFVTSGGLWPPHGVAGTPGAELLPGLVIDGPVIQKGTDGRDGYSGFAVRDPRTGDAEKTTLGGLLHTAGIVNTIIVGLALDYCVGETVLDAVAAGYRTELLLAATRPVDLSLGDGEAMVARCVHAGALVTR